MRDLSVWSVPVLLTYWNEVMMKFEKSESEELILVLNHIEEEIERRGMDYDTHIA